MNPDDIPTEITSLTYRTSQALQQAGLPVLSQNQTAEFLAHYWPAIKAHILREAAVQQRGIAYRLPEHLAPVRDLIGRVADVIDPDALIWMAPARVRDAADDLLAPAEEISR